MTKRRPALFLATILRISNRYIDLQPMVAGLAPASNPDGRQPPPRPSAHVWSDDFASILPFLRR